MASVRKACSVVGVLLLGAVSFTALAPAVAAEAITDGAPAIFVEPDGDALAIRFSDQDPVAVAHAIRDATGIRIDGIDGLRGQGSTSWDFAALPVASALILLAEPSGRLVRREGPKSYAIGPEGEHDRLEALAHDLLEAEETDDAERIAAAERALLDFIRPPPEGPVLLMTDAWLDAAGRAERRQDLVAAEGLLREASRHLQRRDGSAGAEYGRSLARIGRLRALQGHPDEDRMLTEQGLALAEAELGPVDPRLAGMQTKLATDHASAGRLDVAEDLYRRAIEGYGEPELDSIDSLALASALDGLASVFQKQDRWAESIPLLERSFSRYSALFGDDGAGFHAWMLGTALFKLDRLPEAEAKLQFALDHGGPDRARTAALLQSIRWLGPFATAGATDADLAALQAAAVPEDADTAIASISMLLEERAARLRREAPDSTQWNTTCAAYAIVSTAGWGDGKHDDMLRRREKERCEREAIERAKQAPQPGSSGRGQVQH